MKVGMANAAELDGDLDIVGARLAPFNQMGRERFIRGGGGIGFDLQGEVSRSTRPKAEVMAPRAGLD
jgi:hypothetical protein